ncbi:hypothetical protein AB4037_01575 [Labrys sp. KB_33_2]
MAAPLKMRHEDAIDDMGMIEDTQRRAETRERAGALYLDHRVQHEIVGPGLVAI